MSDIAHLVVESGEDKGKRFSVTGSGARLGRSSKNDIALLDPLLSRHHCRFFFKPGQGLCVADLGSSNQTFVNDKAILETKLQPGDVITVGDTRIRVQGADESAAPIAMRPAEDRDKTPTKRIAIPIMLTLAIAAALAAAIWIIPPLVDFSSPKPPDTDTTTPQPEELEIIYERVDASADNIFRYNLVLSPPNILSVEIDDLEGGRHVRKEQSVDHDYLRGLSQSLLSSGFFALQSAYEGIRPDILDQSDISITVGRRTHRVTVRNRPEPDVFGSVREQLEVFARNELGLWAIQYPPERLVAMASDAYALGLELYSQRSLEHGKLAAAIQSLREAEMLLETVEPKPEFYADAVANIAIFTEELRDLYTDHNFLVERAIRLRQWDEAARQLRIICELIPDRSDSRNQEARKKLLEIERRMTER